MASAFQPLQDDLRAAWATRVQAEEAMTGARVTVRFAENALERAIRDVSLRAHGVDNNATTGPAFKALFPDGLDAELRPIGASQVEAAIALRGRVDSQPAAAKVKAQVMDDLDKSLAGFKASLDARSAAEAKVSEARATELGARERFISAYDSNIGAIRQMFPRDRTRQNLFFDESVTNRSSSNNSGGNTPPVPPSDGNPK